MSYTLKLWERVIEHRLRQEIINLVLYHEAILLLRRLKEKYRETHKDLNMVLIDLEKAHHRVPKRLIGGY
jgi:hypothetical protein